MKTKSLALVLGMNLVFVGACPKQVQTPTTTVTGWTDAAHTVIVTLNWAIPATRTVVTATLPTSTVTQIGAVLDTVTTSANGLNQALEAYTSRGGDSCAVYASAGLLKVSLVQLATILADNGFAFGTVLEPVADAVGGLLDNLIPACDASDAGWSSAGDNVNSQLHALGFSAIRRGVVLRRDLDSIHQGR